jgi:hypothetical protein
MSHLRQFSAHLALIHVLQSSGFATREEEHPEQKRLGELSLHFHKILGPENTLQTYFDLVLGTTDTGETLGKFNAAQSGSLTSSSDYVESVEKL